MRFEFLKHSEITEKKLGDVIFLKNIHWPYSDDEHLNWIKKNLNFNDIHVLVYEESDLVAYLNLVITEVAINTVIMPFIGIGNVCSRDKGKGYGKILLEEVNNYLTSNEQYGILFCKSNLIDFYKKFNWTLVDPSLTNQDLFKNINVMLFNFDKKILSFNYLGPAF